MAEVITRSRPSHPTVVRVARIVGIAAGVSCVLAASAQAQARCPGLRKPGPVIAILAAGQSLTSLSAATAADTRYLLARLVPPSRLCMLTQGEVENTFEGADPRGHPWPPVDFRETGRLLHTTAMIDVVASGHAERIQVRAMLYLANKLSADTIVVTATAPAAAAQQLARRLAGDPRLRRILP
jgi:hypothetical protein